MIAAIVSALSWLRGAAVALFGVIARYPWRALCIALLCASLWLWVGKQDARSDLVDMTAARDAEISAHQETKAGYRSAQAAAAELDRQNIARVKQEQAAALKQVETQYANDLSSARAALAERLRTAETRTCSAGGGGGAAMSSVPVLSGGTMRRGEDAIVSIDDATIGLENSIRLQAIIDAWKAVAAVDVSG